MIKKSFLYSLLFLCLSFTSVFGQENEIQIVSFNIRYGTPGDGENKWKSRRNRVMTIFEKYKNGIIATQEANPLQIDQIQKSVKDLGVIYRSRTLEDKKGESNAIFYNKKLWAVDQHETFWLSDTPFEPATKSWGNTLPRICTMVIFKNRNTGKRIKVLNVHLDHRSQNSRERSVELILRTLMTEVETMPLIVLGDFNARIESDEMQRMTQFFSDTYKGDELEGCTYHNYNGGSHCPRIDYVLYDPSSGLRLKNFEIDRWKSKYFYPSDHYPLVATFELR